MAKQFKNPVYLSIIIGITLAWLLALGSHAQSVVRKGNTFIEQRSDTAKRGGAKKTEFIYTDSNGVSDTVYISKNGKAFIWKVSKKTGKKYRKYLPEVTKQITKHS